MQKNEQIVKRELEHFKGDRPIILFGAKSVGIMVKHILDDLAIDIVGFCDNDIALQGTAIENAHVYSLPQVYQQYPKALVIRCSFWKPALDEMLKDLTQIGYEDSIEFWVILYALKVAWEEDVYKDELVTQSIKVVASENSVFIRSVEFDVTEKCTLKCQDCANLIPYFSHPKHYDADSIIESIHRLADSTSGIGVLTLIGGEPFLHPDLAQIVKAVAKIKNIMLIRIVTNGTIIPSDDLLDAIKRYDVHIEISDYGDIVKKRDELIVSLSKHRISYAVVGQRKEWYSFGRPYARNRSIADNKKMFQTCFMANNCISVNGGELRLCARANYGTMLGKMPKNSLDYVNLLDKTKTPEELGETISYLFNNTQYISACDYCDGPYGERVKAAVQLDNSRVKTDLL